MEKFVILFIIALLGSIMPLWSLRDERKIKEEKIVKGGMTVTKMMYVVALSSFAIVIGFFEIPVFITGAKLDLSEVVILISFLILGFKGSTMVIFLRSGIRFFVTTIGTSVFEADPVFKLFGEGIAVIASLLIVGSLMLVNLLLNKRTKPLLYAVPTEKTKVTYPSLIITPIVTAIILTVGMTAFHYFLTVPFYGGMLGIDKSLPTATIIGTLLGFFGVLNVVKGVISPLIFLIIKPKIENIIK